MAEIKGTVLLDTLAAIRARAGEAELAKIQSLLSEPSKNFCGSAIQASTWYPLDAFAEFLEVDIRETANGDREVSFSGPRRSSNHNSAGSTGFS